MTDWYTRPPSGTAGSGTYRGFWTASTTWAAGDRIVPSLAYATAAAKGYVYECTTGGAGGGTEPTWVYTTPDTSTTTDNAAVFTVRLADDWANASTRPDYLFSNKMVAGETIYSETGTYPLTASTTYTLPGTAASPCRWISTTDTSNAPPTTVAAGANMEAGIGGFRELVAGIGYVYGVTLKCGSTAADPSINISSAANSNLVYEECIFDTSASNSSTAYILFGAVSTNSKFLTKTNKCTFKLGSNVGSRISPYGIWYSENDVFNPGPSQPTALFNEWKGSFKIVGADMSAITSTLFGTISNNFGYFELHQCKLGSGVAVSGSQTSAATLDVYLSDCASGDTHFEFAHYNYWGNTTISTAIYVNTADGAAYNVADAKYSWKVTGVNGTFATPYVSPWIDKYNEATSAITPRLEILRDGSATAYNDDQVWADFSYKGTTGFVTATVVSDKCGIVATPAAQASSSLGAGDWTGEGGTAWFGKLEPTSTITPTEIGDISARVSVAGAITVYVNPKILGT